MNIAAVGIAVLMLLSVPEAAAQTIPAPGTPAEKHIERAKSNILAGMRSGNDGLTESVLILVARMSMRFPGIDVREQKRVLDSLSLSHRSESLRYKAHLAGHICADPAWFARDNTLLRVDAERFFLLAGERLQQKMFGMKQ